MCASWLQSSHSVPSSSSVGIPGTLVSPDSPVEASDLAVTSAMASAEAPASQNCRRVKVVLDCSFFRLFDLRFITDLLLPGVENNDRQPKTIDCLPGARLIKAKKSRCGPTT